MSPIELITLGTTIALVFGTLLDLMFHPSIPESMPKRKLPHWLVEMLRKKYLVCPILEYRMGDILLATIIRYKFLEIVLSILAVLISHYLLFFHSDYLMLFDVLAALTGTTIVNNFYNWLIYKVLVYYMYDTYSHQDGNHVNIQRVMI